MDFMVLFQERTQTSKEMIEVEGKKIADRIVKHRNNKRKMTDMRQETGENE